ncbi:nucleotidyl transferase AbiEii/AbiGii toxin family protein [Fibrella sp. HMF5335]|uniref:Nucleotidyl transferase AbiEii/AbiGii toxin family protein n=1 Tax=Fibrella rubiginis TaxID=2817060 RepID=A0A939GIT3_9BACT|nr:nucleotidyl transferase AbiEii/AbiGii toxin family protein [Fibrella rubiginis]MBO0937218.1 nucleotidyl transferase AbiEii/AbiGii toxin family protein [Fibrella rubiginis]
MINLAQVQQQYPASLHGFGRFILREYLQHKLLQLIYDSPLADRFTFLGGTCLRIVHGNNRFSEDLDFDNIDITEADFETLSTFIKQGLQREGYDVEMKVAIKGAYHCHVRFPELLFQQGLSGYREEKVLIQLDTEPQHFPFSPEPYILNRFDVFSRILTTPPSLLLAQKCYAILNRIRNKGRDFYDAVFLLGRGTKPNYDYLTVKVGITSPEQLRERLLAHCGQLDMKAMAADVQPFLFDPNDARKVLYFADYLKQVSLR